ncbi:flagellar hook-length control protein FliK [Pseudooctadecabacter sp.]|uniref:flagellar hook-length control protein FliK n=1 Tax=Pseudooctadecabacter sp. TaxID=1966338 RepID=UPI0025EF6AF9|nr:flagellar hook-length control protein FliK [Pseudooctadecabacter sp.]
MILSDTAPNAHPLAALAGSDGARPAHAGTSGDFMTAWSSLRDIGNGAPQLDDEAEGSDDYGAEDGPHADAEEDEAVEMAPPGLTSAPSKALNDVALLKRQGRAENSPSGQKPIVSTDALAAFPTTKSATLSTAADTTIERPKGENGALLALPASQSIGKQRTHVPGGPEPIRGRTATDIAPLSVRMSTAETALATPEGGVAHSSHASRLFDGSQHPARAQGQPQTLPMIHQIASHTNVMPRDRGGAHLQQDMARKVDRTGLTPSQKTESFDRIPATGQHGSNAVTAAYFQTPAAAFPISSAMPLPHNLHPFVDPQFALSDPDRPEEDLVTLRTTTAVTQTAAVQVPNPIRAAPAVIAQQIALAAAQSSSATTQIHLNPDELGTVRISLTTGDAGLVVSILAERPDTADLMRRNIDSLMAEFASMGYDNPSFTFDGDQKSQDGDVDQDMPDGQPPVAGPQMTPQHTTTALGALDLKL